MRYLAGFVGALALALLVGAVVMWGGLYNFAATDPHNPVVRSAIDTAFTNWVERGADGLEPPGRFTTAQLENGFTEFQEYCVHCHGAPGDKPHEWTTGMRPEPPDLSRATRKWTIPQTYWIVKNGIKMTGMPAFGDTESDRTIWNISAFVNQLPNMSAEEYRALSQRLGGGHSHAGEGHGGGEGSGEASGEGEGHGHGGSEGGNHPHGGGS